MRRNRLPTRRGRIALLAAALSIVSPLRADEILPAGVTDLITTEAMATEFLMLLSEKDGSILTHPALFHATAASLTSTVVRVPHLGLGGSDLLSATTPGSEVANTALSDGHTDVTIAMRAKRYTVDDLARLIVNGKIDPGMFAMDAVIAIAQTLLSLIANVADDFTATAGSSGVDATWNDVLDAKTLLGIAKASGVLLALVHPRQWGDLEIDGLSLGQLPAMTMSGLINTGLEQYKGRYMGIDWFVTSHVPTADAGANRAGGIFARGAIAWADAQMAPENDPNIVELGRGRFERVRKGEYISTSHVVSHAAGVAKAIDTAGVTLKTDA